VKKLWETLNDIGVTMGADKFREIIVDEFTATFATKGWSGDELCMHPDCAKEFCNVIRRKVNHAMIPDDVILRTLINIRRRGTGAVNMKTSK